MLLPYKGIMPSVHPDVYIAEGAKIIGRCNDCEEKLPFGLMRYCAETCTYTNRS